MVDAVAIKDAKPGDLVVLDTAVIVVSPMAETVAKVTPKLQREQDYTVAQLDAEIARITAQLADFNAMKAALLAAQE
jgi:regulator of RNase E activity RraA